ncbi:MAG: hypothetical protein ACXWC4_19740 [Telluria sp.]
MRSLPLTLAALLLAGCSTPQERAAYQQQLADEMMVVYGPACQHLGYVQNTDQWRACIMNLSAKDELRTYLSYPYYYGYGPGYWRGP